MIHYIWDFELARTIFSIKTLEEFSKSPQRERGVSRVFPERKKQVLINCKDLSSFPFLGSPRPQHILAEIIQISSRCYNDVMIASKQVKAII